MSVLKKDCWSNCPNCKHPIPEYNKNKLDNLYHVAIQVIKTARNKKNLARYIIDGHLNAWEWTLRQVIKDSELED
jgi:hypothetical protein